MIDFYLEVHNGDVSEVEPLDVGLVTWIHLTWQYY